MDTKTTLVQCAGIQPPYIRGIGRAGASLACGSHRDNGWGWPLWEILCSPGANRWVETGALVSTVLRRTVGGLEPFGPTQSIGKMSGAVASQTLCSLGANRSSQSLQVCSLHPSNRQGFPVLFTFEKHFYYLQKPEYDAFYFLSRL